MRKLRAFQNWRKICEHWAFKNLNLQHFGSKLTRKRLKTSISKIEIKTFPNPNWQGNGWIEHALWTILIEIEGWEGSKAGFLPPVHLHCEVFTTSSAHLRRSHAGFTSSAYLRRLWGWFLTQMHIWEQGLSTLPVIQHYNGGAPPANSFLWWLLSLSQLCYPTAWETVLLPTLQETRQLHRGGWPPRCDYTTIPLNCTADNELHTMVCMLPKSLLKGAI